MNRPLLLASVVVLLSAAAIPAAQPRTPKAAADELLAADRAFSAASVKSDLVSGLSAMFADDVVLIVPGQFVHGEAAAAAALRADPANLKTRVEWTPTGGGVSADSLHGFTFGFLVTHAPDGTAAPGKYLAYWIKGPDGWRVTAYKRVRAPAGATASAAAMAPLLPAEVIAPSTDTSAVDRHRESLAAAERAFSADSQAIGLGPAFVKYGSPDAINLGGAGVPGFIVGNDAIGAFIGQNAPEPTSPVHWGPDRTIVASSGDLGVTIGFVTENTAQAGQPGPRSFPFFTVWRRTTAMGPWKYVAE